MSSFSHRYGYSHLEGIQKEAMDATLKARIWNAFYAYEFDANISVQLQITPKLTTVEKMMNEVGVIYKFPDNKIHKEQNANALRDYLLKDSPWYAMYDFIEKIYSTMQ